MPSTTLATAENRLSHACRLGTRASRRPRLTPLASALALVMMAGSLASLNAHAQPRPFSSGWFAAKGAAQSQAANTGKLPNGMLAGINSASRQQQAARKQLNRSVNNLGSAAAAIAAQQAAQAAARTAAQNDPSVPDGLAEGGLKIDASRPLSEAWLNAKAPVQSQNGGRTHVAIEQTGDKAILNWETFNVGKNTTVDFKQQADWAVLNRVNDPKARPSQIQGQIKGAGTVMIANANGVVFSGSSQVNVRNLVAAAANISDAQFNSGLFGVNETTATFEDVAGQVLVQQGAQIATLKSANSTTGGGYVLLAGEQVHNAGTITTPNGQTALAAGDSFVITRGQGTEGNQASTTRGNEITARFEVDSTSGAVSNTGLITAAMGDITLAGNGIEQAGVLLASTSVHNRGTVHLNATGTNARVALAEGATTAILVDESATALDSQRDSLLASVQDRAGNIVSGDTYRRDQSLVEIKSAGTVDFKNGSITLATGGQVAVDAAERTLVRDGAIIDVSGAIGVKVAMESNTIQINVQGNEMRDAPVNRDSNPEGNNSHLSSQDVWVDVRELVHVPSGNGYDADRWYTAGGLLEVGGYLGTTPHGAGEWMAQGGTVSFTGTDLITQQGSQINVSGGTLDVQDGIIRQSWLRGADHRLYEISRAPGDILYTGLYQGYEDHSVRWDVTRTFYNPLIAPRQRFEQGYTVGRDAGRLIVGTRNAVLEGGIVGDTYQGARQTQAAQAGLEGYYQPQNAVARRGQLIVGTYAPYYVKDKGGLEYALGANADTIHDVIVGATAQKIAAALDLDTALPEDREGTLYLDANQLNDFNLGGIKIAATQGITVNGELAVGHGGNITLYGPQVQINADLTAHSGSLHLGNVLNQISGTRYDNMALAPESGQASRLNVAEGVRLDASGLWSSGVDRPDGMSDIAYRHGGSVSLRGTGDVNVAESSVIDVSSGAALMHDRSLRGGRGGDITLAANALSNKILPGGNLILAGAVKGYGVSGAGTLSVASGGKVVLGGSPGEDTALHLDAALFQQGFAQYEINGHGGVEVADGAHIAVQMPVYRYEGQAGQAQASDAVPSEALSLWTPPLHQTDLLRGVLTQRQGAALSLTSNRNGVGETIRVGQGAWVEVDPGQAISLVGGGQITIEGRLEAPGGRIVINDTRPDAQAFNAEALARSVWIGEQAVLDVSGRSAVALDRDGRRYGQVLAGGQIDIGGTLDWETGEYRTDRAMDRHIIIRPGALLDASGTQAVLDLPGRGATTVASDGGSIVLVSASSLYLDGALRAAAGGEGAAGGTLGLSLNSSAYYPLNPANAGVLAPRILTLMQTQGDSLLAADLQPGGLDGGPVYGTARLGVDRIEAGGFGSLAIDAAVRIEGDLNLALAQSLRFSGAIGMHDDAPEGSTVRLHAPHVRFDQALYEPLAGGDFYSRPGSSPLDWMQRGHTIAVQADLLDVRGLWDFRNFDDVSLFSRGDVRLLNGVDTSTGATQLLAPQNMTVTAAQIYPVTGAQARIAAGYYYAAQDSLNNPDATLVLRSPDGQVPPVPYSAFGYLRVHAPSIEQGTVLRAPLGFIEIGATEQYDSTSSVRFLPGSLTSVSGSGLVMPYGGTADGINYQYDGANIEPTPAGGNHNNPRYRRMLAINGNSIEVEPGAVLDLNGGGELQGAGFVSGRGGSVDILKHALGDSNPAAAFSQAGNDVYAIVPSFSGAYAPIVAESGAGAPAFGQQVTIERGLPGLPAGVYTLLPSTYALLPGAFRVEVGALSDAQSGSPVRTRAGAWATTGYLGTANTGQRNVLGNRLLVMPADVLRRHSQYNETSYAEFLLADAARRGIPRAMLPVDASQLDINLRSGAGMGDTPALRVEGEARFQPAAASQGFGGTLSVSGPAGGLEVLAPGQAPISGADAAAVSADALTSLRPSRLVLGSVQGGAYGTGMQNVSGSSVILRAGATLAAPEILLAGASDGSIIVEQGATLTTLGMGPSLMDARNGYYLNTLSSGVLAVSNGYVTLVPPLYDNATRIELGGCLASCEGATRIVSEGTIGVATNGVFSLGETVEYGTRNLLLSVSSLNLGSAQALADAQAAGHLPPGMALRQDVLDNLLRGNTALGTPALESLILTAGESVNIFGEVMLDTRGASGAPSLQRLVLGAPAIYGYGSAGDAATIIANEFVWAGSLAADRASIVPGYATPATPGGVLVDQLGDGSLAISADVIRFDATPYTTANSLVPAERLVLGFSSLTLDASRMVTGAGNGGLAMHHQLDGQDADGSWRYRGGDLLVRTPMLTGEAGASLDMRAGGALTVQGTGAAPGATGALGAALSLAAQRLLLDSAIVLPSGKLALEAQEDIILGDAARIDLSGREVEMMDVKRYSLGGDLVMQSVQGNITQSAGSVIDLSARNNRGGRLQAIALGEHAGRLELAGAIVGGASGIYNAGGTLVPYDSAEVTLRAQTLADFAGLNTRLTEGGVFGARRFHLKQGDLVVGDEVRARHVEIMVDGGNLTVNGRIDASGMQTGSIRLAAQGDLLVQGMLDAHATGLRVDSYRQIVESTNRAIVDLTSRTGTLTLGQGAAVDLRAGTDLTGFDGRAMGTLDLNARRLGGGAERGALAGSGDGANDVAVNVVGTPVIRGAKTIAVNAFRRYNDAPLAAQPDVTGKTPQLINQSYLNGIDGESIAFVDAALGNAGLRNRLAGLGDYRLRPGVEIVSATSDGDLTVEGDLDLSGYRYGPGANRSDLALRGFGEPGVLVLRAGGNLNIHGSINDGFAPPPDTPDEDGWWLIEGRYSDRVGQTPFGGDLVVPIDGVTLEAGTTFMPGVTLNYDLPADAATLPAGTLLPIAVTLNGALNLPAGLVLTGEVTMVDGNVLPAGTVLKDTLGLTAGARLGAGFRLRTDVAVQAFTWPKGVQLPVELVASGPIALARGSVIPAQTKVELLGDAPVRLRAAGDGRNWALAPMLGEGATSWSLTAVAGADLGSADVQARNALGTGDIVLADTHYGMLGTNTTRFEGGGGGGPLVLTPDGALGTIGDPALAGMTQEEIDQWLLDNWGVGWDLFFAGLTMEGLCGWGPGFCVALPGEMTLTPDGALNMFGDPSLAGMTQDEINVWLVANWGLDWEGLWGPGVTLEDVCAPEWCVAGGSTPPTEITEYHYALGTPLFSVLRTGTGDLSLLAGRDVGMMSVYGVYTAGTPTSLGTDDAQYNLARGTIKEGGVLGKMQGSGDYDAALAAYQAWYPDHGGNLTVSAGRDVYGDVWGDNAQNGYTFSSTDKDWSRHAGSAVGNWLWRQGNHSTPGVEDIATSWWINFGTYVNNSLRASGQPRVVGFTGFGTLGGGNLSISAERHAGVRDARGDALRDTNDASPRSQGLVAAVGSTGRVVDGELVLTGGGDLDLRVGSALNPTLRATQQSNGTGGQGGSHRLAGGSIDHLDLNGVLTNLRGNLTLSAGQVGGIALTYGDGAGLRAIDPFAVGGGLAMGGPVLMLGDATAWLDTRGDLVLGGASDPGRTRQLNSNPYRLVGAAAPETGGGESWFSLWTPDTAVNLFSAGGNLTPITAHNSLNQGTNVWTEHQQYFVYPSILRAVAAQGDIILPIVPTGGPTTQTLLLAPSRSGELEMLAGGSILAQHAPAVSLSGADTPVASPLRPAFTLGSLFGGDFPITNVSREAVMTASGGAQSLFAFGPNTPLETAQHAGDETPARFYAVQGDIVGLQTGGITSTRANGNYIPAIDRWVEAAVPVSVRAGQDILGFTGVALHNNSHDVSLIQATRDIVHADFTVAGPGTVVLQAGRQIRQEDQASVHSIGGLVRGDTRPGASIVVLAGVGAAGPDYSGFLARYLTAANRIEHGLGLDIQPDRVVQTYEGELTLSEWLHAEFGYSGPEEGAAQELLRQQALRDADPTQSRRNLKQDYLQESDLHLVNWLRTHQGYEGDEATAHEALAALAPAQRDIYARQLYFAELRKGGREYNDADGPRLGSYLRGRRAIAALFPEQDANGAAIRYEGDFTMYGGAGLRTDFGGGIQVLTPGGQQVHGIEGAAPPSTAGVVTQGQGDIQMYSLGSILLGQSRIMTTFGGHIQAWSAEGDINAGRGSKTTVVYTPPRRVYDQWGNVTLSPVAPSTGAGIATLNPIAEVEPGDVDLVAPLGTIDAGEAGIRVSGNVNIAALHVVNAANIQVQGESTGIPVMAAVNVGALTSASAASASAASAAQDTVSRARNEARQNQPSIFSVRILGFGNETVTSGGSGVSSASAPASTGATQVSYQPNHMVQVLGRGQSPEGQGAGLTADERRSMGL